MNSTFSGDIQWPDPRKLKMLDSSICDSIYAGGFFFSSYEQNLVYAGSRSAFAISTDSGANFKAIIGPWDQFVWDGRYPY